MLKAFFIALVLMSAQTPAFAQDDFPRLQVGVGGANMRLPAGGKTSSRHVGLVVQTGFNLTRSIGIENYNAFYSVGNGAVLGSNIVGAKVMARPAAAKFMVPYGVVGVGIAHITPGGYKFGSGNMLATRFALGSDFPLSRSVAFRVDVGLLSVHPGSVQNGINGSLGFVFNLKN